MKILTSLLLLSFTLTSFAFEAKILKVHGEVSVGQKLLKVGDRIQEGEEVHVIGPKSLVQVNFSDGSRMVMKEGVLKVLPSQSRDATALELISGELFAEKFKKQGSLSVKTKFASMGVRGTKFYVQQKADDTYLCVCEGQVEFKNKSKTELVSLREDATVKSDAAFEKTKANDMMWDMANAGFKEMIK